VYPKPTYQEAKMIVLIQTSVSLRLLWGSHPLTEASSSEDPIVGCCCI
jgi:hypothetical protein